MKLFNYLPEMTKLDKKGQLKVRVKINPLKVFWQRLKQTHDAEKLKLKLIRKYNLNITTRTFENYIYKSAIPLKFIYALVKFTKNYQLWNSIFDEMDAVCYRCSGAGKTLWVKLPKEITAELAYLAGALRDGNLNIKIGRTFIAQKEDKAWLKQKITNIFENTFGIKPTIDERATIYSFPIAYFLYAVLQHKPGRQTEWETPSWIFKIPNKLKRIYVRGYFDAEGTSNPKRMKIAISQGWYKREIAPSLVEIKKILKEVGIESSLEGPYRKVKRWSFMSNVVIYCKKNPKNGILFFEKIGTEHNNKIKNLTKIYRVCQDELIDSHNRA